VFSELGLVAVTENDFGSGQGVLGVGHRSGLVLSMIRPAQLLEDRFPQVLQQMKAVRHLSCLWRTLTRPLSIKAAAITADHLNLWMFLEPTVSAGS
jgi:hypothetical protein